MTTQPSWQDEAEALWGADWIAPLGEVLNVNRRSLERYRSGARTAPDWLALTLRRVVEAAGGEPRIMGDLLRRVARGEDVEGTIRLQQAALRQLPGLGLRLTRTQVADAKRAVEQDRQGLQEHVENAPRFWRSSD